MKNLITKIKNLFKNKSDLELSKGDFTRPVDADNDDYDLEKQNKKKSLYDQPTENSIVSESSIIGSQSINSMSLPSSSKSAGIGTLTVEKKFVPLIGLFNTKTQYQIIVGLIALSALLFFAGIFSWLETKSNQTNARNGYVVLMANYQKLDASLNKAISGDAAAFEEIKKTKKEISKIMIENESYASSLGAKKDLDISKLHKVIDEDWKKTNELIDKVLKEEEILKNSVRQVEDLSDKVETLIDLVERLQIIFIQSGANQNELANGFNLRFLLHKLNSNVVSLLLTNSITPELIDTGKRTRNAIRLSLIDFYSGNSSRNIRPINQNAIANATYEKIAKKWVEVADRFDAIYAKSNEIVTTKKIGAENAVAVSALYTDAQKLSVLYESKVFDGYWIAGFIAVVGFVLGIFSLVLGAFVYLYEKENATRTDKLQNFRNQNAILLLLNEIEPIADGDLTKHTTVTEDITGAIADSINMTVRQLSSLVQQIKISAVNMRRKTLEANINSEKMISGSREQFKEISHASESMINIANAVNNISDQTAKTAEVAHNSVKLAITGAKSVRASMDAMDTIRENSNETVKLMNRLDESSKEIYNIVELLSDISEQTSVLALSASLQAVKAGEQGRGFKIVADSVKELANKAAEATRRVGALVGATQTDIQRAVEAAQKTNNEVERGTQLSEQAGEVLTEITNKSFELSGFIKQISDDTKNHAQSASLVSNNMLNVLRITQETASFNQKTAKSIQEVAKVSSELADSVRNFKVEENK